MLAGGTESMSQAPHTIRGARWGIPLGQSKMGDLLWESLYDPYAGFSMAETAENLADKYKLTRAEVRRLRVPEPDADPGRRDAGRFDDEIVPVELVAKKGHQEFAADEHPRPTTTPEILAKLPPYFKKDGVVDGRQRVRDRGRSGRRDRDDRAPAPRPRGALSWGASSDGAIAGCDPRIMGIGPAPSTRKALADTGLELDDIDLYEVNEAFAPQTVAVMKELGLDHEKLNVNGGAIAIGHPLAATGTRCTITLLYEMKRRGARLGFASACIGGGQGSTVVVEAA